jgi:hypothetical protein
MTLRNPLDHDIAKTPGTAMKFVWGGTGNLKGVPGISGGDDAPPVPRPRTAPREPREVVAQAPPPKKETPFVMEILSGTTRSETKFEKTPEVNK